MSYQKNKSKPSTISQKRIKYLGMNLTNTYSGNYKAFM